MAILIAGLSLFLGIHCVPVLGGVRSALIHRLGEKRYQGAFSLLAAAGLALIIWGKAVAPFESVYLPPAWGRSLAIWVMPVVFILLAAANMPTKIRRSLKHPMLIATLLWATVHLSANGDLASILLFGGFGMWALIDLISATVRGKLPKDVDTPLSRDAMAIVGGLGVYGLVLYLHVWLFGAAVI